MPTVGQPQIFNLPDETAAYQSLGQGGGQLLAALLNLYRRQGGGGTYTSPTGATAQISPAEQQLQRQLVQRAALGQGTFQPRRLSFLGPTPISPQALPRLQLQQAQSEVEEAPLKRKKLEAETKVAEGLAKFYETFFNGAENAEGIPGGKIVTVDETGKPVPAGTPGARQFLITPTKTGPKTSELSQPTPERVQAASAVDSMLTSLDDLERMLSEDPSRLVRSNIPFMEREFKAVVDQFDKEAAIAAGGKQLTETELNLIRRTRPTIQDFKSPEAIKRKINKLRQIGLNAKARLSGTTPKSTPENVTPSGLKYTIED